MDTEIVLDYDDATGVMATLAYFRGLKESLTGRGYKLNPPLSDDELLGIEEYLSGQLEDADEASTALAPVEEIK